MISKVDICNLALSHIGARSITSLDESTEQARQCSLLFETCRDSVLRAHEWNFATRIKPLAQIANEEAVGWTFVYQYPTKCLYIRRLFTEATVKSAKPDEFKQVIASGNTRAIAANIEGAYIEYTEQVVDPAAYDTAFVEALSYKLAAELAQPLTGKAELSTAMLSVYRAMIEDAKRANASEGYEEPVKSSDYVDAR